MNDIPADQRPESVRSISDEDIVTERKLPRRSFLRTSGALLASGAGVVATAGMARAQDDPDKKPEDPDKRRDDTRKRADDTHKRSDDTHKRADDTHKREDDTHKRTEDPDKRVTDPDKSGDPHRQMM